jgi:hypothetical protein
VAPIANPEPLIELDPTTAHERWLAHGSFKAVIEWAGDDERRLQEVAAARGYKSGWVYFRLKAKRDAAEDTLLRALQF